MNLAHHIMKIHLGVGWWKGGPASGPVSSRNSVSIFPWHIAQFLKMGEPCTPAGRDFFQATPCHGPLLGRQVSCKYTELSSRGHSLLAFSFAILPARTRLVDRFGISSAP